MELSVDIRAKTHNITTMFHEAEQFEFNFHQKHRLEISINGKPFIAASLGVEPKNLEELITVLREISVAAIVEDKLLQ